MYKTLRDGINLKDINNEYTLNIFTDASIKSVPRGYDGCYGAIAVYNDTIIDEIYRVNSGTTNNNAEIKGVRAGVYLALKYQHTFKMINIFSDSQISIFGIRDRIASWVYDAEKDCLVGKQGQVIANQDVYLEIVYLMIQHNLRVNFLHQKGHVTNHINSIREAQHVFENSNLIRGTVDLNLIRFISRWNSIVDVESRDRLLHCNHDMLYKDAIEFKYEPFNRVRYSRLSRNNGVKCD
jgi:ribonuclease HI